MKLTTINEQTMLKGVKRFIMENPIDPPNLRVTALAAEIDNAIEGIDLAATAQVDGSGNASGGVATKREKAVQLRDYLKDVARVARSLDREAHPGVAEQFLLPRRRSYAALLAAARAMIADAAEIEAELIAHGLAANFLAELNALADALENGSEAKIGGLQTQVGGTAGLKHRASLGVQAAQKLDAIFRAHFRNDPVTLAVWRHARHIAVANAPTPAAPALPPPPSGGDGGSGGTGGTEGGSAA